MKKFISFVLALAILLTSVVIPNNEVRASEINNSSDKEDEKPIVSYLSFEKNYSDDLTKLGWSKKNQFAINTVEDSNGESIDSSHYTLTVEKVSTNKSGYGTYNIILQCDAMYNNSYIAKTVTVVPNSDEEFGKEVEIGWTASGYNKYSKYNNKYYSDMYFVLTGEDSKYYKNIDGVQYVIAKDSKYKNVYVKGTKKYKPKKACHWYGKAMEIAHLGKTKIGKKIYVKYRTYVLVNGKKVYSDWQYEVFNKPKSEIGKKIKPGKNK